MRHLAFVLLLFAFPLQAETVIYRCGKLYSSEPCPQAQVIRTSSETNVILATPVEHDAPDYTIRGGTLPSYGRPSTRPTGYTVATPFGQFSSKDPIRVDGVGLRQGVTINGITYRRSR